MSKHKHHPILQKLGSLNLAIFVLVFLAILLTIATWIEGQYGTRNANLWIYKTRWFDLVLGLVFVNIFFATWLRMPFRRSHTGFVMTHAGILIILIGSFITRQIGQEGMLSLFEGEQGNAIVQEGTLFKVYSQNSQIWELDTDFFEDKEPNLAFSLPGTGQRILIEKVSAHSEDSFLYTTAQTGLKNQPALRFSLKGQMANLENQWLATHNPKNPQASTLAIGPAQIELKNPVSPQEAQILLAPPEPAHGNLYIRDEENPDQEIVLSVRDLMQTTQTPTDGLKLEFLDYYPFATVIENTLQNDPGEQFANPAIRFLLTTDESSEPVLRFQNIPEFKSSRETQSRFSFRYQDAMPVSSKPKLTLIPLKDGSILYASQSSRGRTTGTLSLGSPAATGWMDFTLTVHEYIPNATAIPSMVMVAKSPLMKSVRPAVRFRILNSRNEMTTEHTVRYGEDYELNAGDQNYRIQFGPKLLHLPFSIELKDFRKIDYPGTSRAMSYESDVIVTDPAHAPVTFEKTIKMNHILIHQGWKFYQADFEILPDGREISRLQVGYDPGTSIIYFGCILMVLGIITMFWFKPSS